MGKAVASSGLLNTIAVTIQSQVEGFSLFGIILTIGIFVLTIATFISHTVSALILIPLVSELGHNMPDPHPRMLILSTALLCSAAMGLLTSDSQRYCYLYDRRIWQAIFDSGTFIKNWGSCFSDSLCHHCNSRSCNYENYQF